MGLDELLKSFQEYRKQYDPETDECRLKKTMERIHEFQNSLKNIIVVK